MRERAEPMREQTAAAVHASPTAISVPRILSISLIGGVVLGLLGPLGSSALPLAVRLGYWIVAVLGGSVLGWAATLLVMRWPRARGSAWLMILAIAVIMTPPGAVLVWAWGRMAVPDHGGLGTPLTLAGPVFVIALAMTAINRLTVSQGALGPVAPARAPEAKASDPQPPSAPAFQNRLPPRLRGAAIHAVEAEDHYLRVHTAAGSDLILMRLGDALGELAALDGEQTHRSWWVARSAVRSVSRADGRATLTLEGGVKAPVSRGYAAQLRDAGWF